jgi:rhodanese-related sulfurtransferase
MRSESRFEMALRQFLILILLSAALALIANTISPNGIPLVGDYRSLSSGDGPIVPPTAELGDPPFIDINQAHMEHEVGQVTFIDARDLSEFECGTIPGSVSIPFEYLPEGDISHHIDSALGGVAKDHKLVVFCSGEECDLSLHLGRNLYTLGYTDVLIFFGGSREWENFGFEIERRVECGE